MVSRIRASLLGAETESDSPFTEISPKHRISLGFPRLVEGKNGRFNCIARRRARARSRSLGDISRAFMRDEERRRDRLIAENDGRRGGREWKF